MRGRSNDRWRSWGVWEPMDVSGGEEKEVSPCFPTLFVSPILSYINDCNQYQTSDALMQENPYL
jgi:hypothetical protein